MAANGSGVNSRHMDQLFQQLAWLEVLPSCPLSIPHRPQWYVLSRAVNRFLETARTQTARTLNHLLERLTWPEGSALSSPSPSSAPAQPSSLPLVIHSSASDNARPELVQPELGSWSSAQQWMTEERVYGPEDNTEHPPTETEAWSHTDDMLSE